MRFTKRLFFLLLTTLILQGCTPQQPAPDSSPITNASPSAKSHVVLAYDRSSGEKSFETEIGILLNPFAPALPVHDGKLFLGSEIDGEPAVVAVEAAGGKIAWSHKLTGSDVNDKARSISFLLSHGVTAELDHLGSAPEETRNLPGIPLTMDGNTVYSATDEKLISFNTEKWTENWQVDYAGVSAVAVTDTGQVAAVNPNGVNFYESDAVEKWTKKLPFQPTGVSVGSEHIFVATEKRVVTALDPKAGETVWEKSWEEQESGYGAPVFLDGVVAYSTGNEVVGLDGKSGEELWKVEDFRGDVTADPAKSQLFLRSSNKNRLICINAADGKKVWSAEPKLKLLGSPRYSEDKVYCAGVKGVE